MAMKKENISNIVRRTDLRRHTKWGGQSKRISISA